MIKKFPFTDFLNRSVLVRTEEEANSIIWDYTAYIIQETNKNWAEAQEIVLRNIGYYAGYYDRKTQERVYKLFKTEHPIFGTKQPTTDEALHAGIKMAEDNIKNKLKL